MTSRVLLELLATASVAGIVLDQYTAWLRSRPLASDNVSLPHHTDCHSQLRFWSPIMGAVAMGAVFCEAFIRRSIRSTKSAALIVILLE